METLIAGPEGHPFAFDSGVLAAAALDAFPGSERATPLPTTAHLVSAIVVLPTTDAVGSTPPLAGAHGAQAVFHAGGHGVDVDGHDPRQIAEFVAWLCREAQVPASGEFVLLDFAPGEMIPLTPETTADDLMSRFRAAGQS